MNDGGAGSSSILTLVASEPRFSLTKSQMVQRGWPLATPEARASPVGVLRAGLEAIVQERALMTSASDFEDREQPLAFQVAVLTADRQTELFGEPMRVSGLVVESR